MSESNPFAPAAEPGTFRPAGATAGPRSIDLDKARKALAAHVASGLASDAATRGSRIRIGGPVGLGVGLLLLAGGAVAALTAGYDDAQIAIGAIVGVIGFLVALVAGIYFGLDFRLTDVEQPHSAADAARTYWRAMAMRPPFAWTQLAPTARELSVELPDLAPVVVTPGPAYIGAPQQFKEWGDGFARIGGGQQRQTRIVVDPVIVVDNGDYAETETHVEFSSVPRWVLIVAAVAFVLIRLLGLIVFVIAQFAMRQKRTVVVRQRWLKASTGAWYLLDAQLAF